MIKRGTTIVATASVFTLACALSVLKADTTDGGLTGRDTLALAPMSLGNRAAAGTLKLQNEDDPSLELALAPMPRRYTQNVRVGRGDTLAEVLDRAGIDRRDAHEAITALSTHYNLRRLPSGQRIALTFESLPDDPAANAVSDDSFVGLSLDPDYKTRITVARTTNGAFEAAKEDKILIKKPAAAQGRISSSLYVSGRDAGVPAVVIARMIRLLSWDVDFQRDIRKGDTFEVMYERIFDDNGKAVYNGNVTFVSLTLSGKRTTIYRFESEDGRIDYFDENGKSSRKALMRTPIDGARLSSTFGKRKHPILGYTRMHKGVDFAAPTGTPIYAAGNGTVEYAGRKGSFGNYIRLRHNGTYQTAYAHLHGFAKGVRTGKRVNQGDVIGYVGTTGRSTGPHLHYEVMRSGQQVNPLKIKMPSGDALEGSDLAAFEKLRRQLDQQFAALAPEEVASADTPDDAQSQ